jgi:hypothetical protein
VVDDFRLFESLHPATHLGCRQMNDFAQGGVCRVTITLQFGEQSEIVPIHGD